MERHEHDHQETQKPAEKAPKKYWKSLSEYENSPEFQKLVDNEFMASPFFDGEVKDSFNRRDFVKLMGASLALGSTACIRRPVQTIVPYVNRPVEVTPGLANWYASTWTDGVDGLGLLVKTREGRPIKLEGNPDHPVNAGALSVRAQAQVLGLYDRDRLKGPRKRNADDPNPFRRTQHPGWSQVDEAIVPKLKEGGVFVLSASIQSPSTRDVLNEFAAATKATIATWDPMGYDDIAVGQRASYGTYVVPRYVLDRARMIVSIDTDFLGTFLSPTEYNRQFIAGRKPGKDMSKLVVFESMYTLTGANSDTRVRIKPSQQIEVVLGLVHEVMQAGGKGAGLPAFANVAGRLGIEDALFKQIAKDLWENRGRSLVLGSGFQTRTENSEALQVAVNYLNSLLGNDGVTVDYAGAPHRNLDGSYTNIQALIERMNAGEVKTLIIHKVNPVYNLPPDSGFVEALAKVLNVIYTGDRIDETGAKAHWILPDHHHLENWGDAEIQDQVFSIQQPTIRPLYDTRAFQDTLLTWTHLVRGAQGKPQTWYAYLKESWRRNRFRGGGNFDNAWNQLLQVGVLDASGSARDKTSGTRAPNLSGLKVPAANKREGLELVLYPTVCLGDGRDANNAWLQEMPDPVTKVSWGNYASVSPATAKKLHLEDGAIVRLSANGRTIELPAHVQPGLHDEVIAVAIGYGRTAAGEVGTGVGVNALELATFGKGRPVFSGLTVELQKTGRYDEIAKMQEHHSMEGRQIVVEASLKNYLEKPDAGIHRHEVFSIWSSHKYPGYRWAMAIDLNNCTGCSACIIACQAENNTPVVGKKYVIQGREMHWLRVDRYYTGDPSNPRAVYQPLPCQHCENAPCETVCPVAATTHSSEGLNDMTYNRCVGTRYCSNNCPYKVRRFNWFNYAKNIKEPMNMVLNPDVGVRTRGVMEKCTFCVQRITQGKHNAKDRGEVVKDGEIQTACQQTCPTNAIVFGNINDEGSVVRKWSTDPRAYSLLEELAVKPSVRYLSRIRNADDAGDSHGAGHGTTEGGH
ncbi:MAG TPA: TAT-variant-translocated molybdopterin oxidoreductase [Bdellovibrionales bacterium]|nr:TAT-variant-translocated molybdopterin oxidoreductase [Bdellovibrionales bacterium]